MAGPKPIILACMNTKRNLFPVAVKPSVIPGFSLRDELEFLSPPVCPVLTRFAPAEANGLSVGCLDAQTESHVKISSASFSSRSYTRLIRHLVDIGAPAEKEVIQ
jgi:hypothetical protein